MNWNWKSKEDSLTPFGDLQQFEASFVSTSSCKPQWVMFQNRRTPRCSLVAEEFFAGCRRNFFPLQLTTSADIGHRAFWLWLLNGFSANPAGSWMWRWRNVNRCLEMLLSSAPTCLCAYQHPSSQDTRYCMSRLLIYSVFLKLWSPSCFDQVLVHYLAQYSTVRFQHAVTQAVVKSPNLSLCNTTIIPAKIQVRSQHAVTLLMKLPAGYCPTRTNTSPGYTPSFNFQKFSCATNVKRMNHRRTEVKIPIV